MSTEACAATLAPAEPRPLVPGAPRLTDARCELLREITVLDVVEAIDGVEPAFRCSEIRRRGPSARPAREYRVPCAIHAVMDRADEAWRDELRAVSIADLMARVVAGASPKGLEQGAQWMEVVLR